MSSAERREQKSAMIDAGKLTRWYDAQAPCYRLWRNRYGGALQERTAALLAQSGADPERLLDAGCGTGLFAVEFARRWPRAAVVGADASTGMLHAARREALRLGVRNVAWYRADVAALPHPDGCFDAIVAAGLLPNLADPHAALSELSRVVAPGGAIVVVEFDRAAMTRATRLFFGLMIFGWRVVSLLRPRFRFARRWGVEESTIDSAAFEASLASCGLAVRRVERAQQHLLYALARERA